MNMPTSISRGDQTREQLTAAAFRVFGRDGFHAASTRAIAQEADVNQALIGYHFGGKEGLYLALFEIIAARMEKLLGPMLDQIDQMLEQELPQLENPSLKAVDAIETLLLSLVESFYRKQTGSWAHLLMREQQDPTAAFDILYQGCYGRLLEQLTELVAIADKSMVSKEQIRLCAFSLLGQVMIFRSAPTTLNRLLGWSELDNPEITAIKNEIRGNLRIRFGGNHA